MPVKFSLRVAEAVDPAQPFVYNEELTIIIYEEGYLGNILQESTYGDTARDYRIDSIGELYITNFRTLKTPKTYIKYATLRQKPFPVAIAMVNSITIVAASLPSSTKAGLGGISFMGKAKPSG